MAVVRPFRAVRYNPQKVKDPSKVTAPPYDVISREFKEELQKRHPHNIIRLILGKTHDTSDDTLYEKAREYLEGWLKEGVLIRDERPALYPYTQTYQVDGRPVTRTGFIGLARLEEPEEGGIKPHERTLSGPKADRLKLLAACQANLSCIFSLYPEDGGSLQERSINSLMEDALKGPPLVEAIDDDGVIHRLWKIDDPQTIEAIATKMKDKELFIADGHHRYETALKYRQMMLEKTENPTGEEPFDHVMMYFTSMADPGLLIFPTHRVVHSLEDIDREGLLEECKKYFDVDPLPFDEATEEKVKEEFLERLKEESEEKIKFGLYVRDNPVYYMLTFRGKEVMDALFGSSMAEVHKGLDVTVLHSVILEKILGIDREAQEAGKNLTYIKDARDALKVVEGGNNQLLFLMNPTRIEDIRRVSEAGLLMPQKSTYFYPKLLSGLVINLLKE